jgi:hypothetical protein
VTLCWSIKFQDLPGGGIDDRTLWLVLGDKAPRDRGNFLEEIDQEMGNDVAKALTGRKIFVAEGDGRMGMTPIASQSGDLLVILVGVPMPVVLRAVTCIDGVCFLFVGACYVNGLMSKGAMEKLRPMKQRGDEAVEAGNKADLEVFDIV